MIRALYSASSGMVAQTVKQDVLANNIANAQTAGFKRQKVTTTSFAQSLDSSAVKLTERELPPYPRDSARTVTAYADAQIDTTQGPIHQTGNPLDFAIDGPGEFMLADGRTTRNGSFRINVQGELCSVDGTQVMGDLGPVRMPEGTWEVKPDGSIASQSGVMNTIKIVNGQPGKTSINQGSIEGANLSIVSEMVQMIANMRSFEANQRVVVSVDQTLDKLINQAGSV